MTDSLVWSALAAGAISKIGAVDLVICGKESVDVATDQHTYQLARRLGWTMLSYVSAILKVDYARARSKSKKCWNKANKWSRPTAGGYLVMKGINEPRYPNFLGIRKAAKATIPVWTASDLAIDLPRPATEVLGYANPPARKCQRKSLRPATRNQRRKPWSSVCFRRKYCERLRLD